MSNPFGKPLGMPRRRCGRTGLYMSALALNLSPGAGADLSLRVARALVHRALEWNINHIDLASGDGTVRRVGESRLGRLLEYELKGHRDELIITTNAGERAWPGPYGAGGSRKHILASLDQTLRRLGLEYVDFLCAGPFDHGTPLGETMGAVQDAVREGKARYAGVSSYSSSQTVKAIGLLDRLGARLAVHHSVSNVFAGDPQPALTRVLESDGVGGIRHYRRNANTGPRTHRDALLTDLARRRGQTLTQVAIAWALQDPSVASVSLPAASIEDVDEFGMALENLSFTMGERMALAPWADRAH
jgi:L-glyceraldehyde 3-phosphate reductase